MTYYSGRTYLSHRSRTLANGTPSAGVVRSAPTHEEIAALAYTYWETRGRQHGSALEDWLRAERELSRPRQEQP